MGFLFDFCFLTGRMTRQQLCYGIRQTRNMSFASFVAFQKMYSAGGGRSQLRRPSRSITRSSASAFVVWHLTQHSCFVFLLEADRQADTIIDGTTHNQPESQTKRFIYVFTHLFTFMDAVCSQYIFIVFINFPLVFISQTDFFWNCFLNELFWDLDNFFWRF